MKNLNFFIKKHLIIKKIKNNIYIFCIIRKKFISFNKEEVVRQYIIFILKNKNYKDSNFCLEFPIYKNGKLFFLDMLIKKNNLPYIIIECKSPLININQKTFDQISIYNKIINSPYLMISNGIQHFIFKLNKYKKKFFFIKFIP